MAIIGLDDPSLPFDFKFPFQNKSISISNMPLEYRNLKTVLVDCAKYTFTYWSSVSKDLEEVVLKGTVVFLKFKWKKQK